MALLLMDFMHGFDTDMYQENINGVVTRWFDLEGNEVTLPYDCAYTLKDDNPPKPEWYVDPEGR